MDLQSMPKGSPERKGAVAEQRRALAAAAREKKAAKKAEGQPEKPAAEPESGALESKEVYADMAWAYRHFKTKPAKAPSGGQAFWLRIAQENPEHFYTVYFVKAQEHEEERLELERRRRENPNYDKECDIQEAYDKGYVEGWDACSAELEGG